MPIPSRKAAAGIVAGTTYKGDPVKLLVDDDGAIVLADDASVTAVLLLTMQGILKELKLIRAGMQEEYLMDFEDLDDESEEFDDNESV